MTRRAVMLALSTICVTMSAEDHAQTAGPCSMSGGDAVTTDTRIDPATIDQVVAVDDMLRLVALVAAERHRDPMKALADRLLDLRLAVRG